MSFLRTDQGFTKNQTIKILRTAGWKRKNNRWFSPYHKRLFQNISLREAASLEGISSSESLS